MFAFRRIGTETSPRNRSFLSIIALSNTMAFQTAINVDSYKPHLREFANLLRACSKTLTWLHLDIDARRM